MDIGSVTMGLAILAGLASFLSPCVLSLVPAYVSYLGGRAISSGGGVVSGTQTMSNRWLTFTHGLAFVAGFSIVFVLLGVAASLISELLGAARFQVDGAIFNLRDLVAKIGGLIVVVFGLHTMGVITIPFLEYDTRKQMAPRPEWGYASSALMGIFFSAGWAPCVGPVLGAMLTAIANSQISVASAAWLLSGYSFGLAVPFLVAALALGEIARFIRQYSRYTRYVSIATGVVLVAVGILLFSGQLQRLAGLGSFFNFGI
jgi:cytochrome c-type biogenesis protein